MREMGASGDAADLYNLTEESTVLSPFAFASGEVLANLRIHYRTLGTPRRDSSGKVINAVVVLHGTGGSGAAFLRPQFADLLFGPGQLLDAEAYYIILPDAIGHGQSAKPSDGLRAAFPRYRYADMVNAQYRLVTESLQVDHLRLVMGSSMGGMHTWIWGIEYPEIADALMPLACLPAEIAGRNRMIRRMAIDSIRLDPAWREGNYRAQPHGLRGAVHALLFMVSVPLQWQEMAPTRECADALFDDLVTTYLQQLDANDLLYQIEASADYNPGPGLERIQARLIAVNSADDQVNPPELGILEREIGRVVHGRAVVLPISGATRGHRSHSHPELWQTYLAELLAATQPA